MDSQPHFQPEDSLDVKLVEEKEPLSTCGRTMPHADSLEEDSCTTDSRSVKLENHTAGKELPDVSEDQSLPTRASTTKPVTLKDTEAIEDTDSPSSLVSLSANATDSEHTVHDTTTFGTIEALSGAVKPLVRPPSSKCSRVRLVKEEPSPLPQD